MCGINGFIQYNSCSTDDNARKIRVMNSCIVYRGPDDEGIYSDEYAALGMRRLSIIDLAMGHQPIFNEDNSKLIIFNGEIYNYRELKLELKVKGHIFRTESDTEAILHSYEEYGAKCLDKLNGMFAFAIYDKNEKELFIARDRGGEKPLFYYADSERFVFASEIKSINSILHAGINIDAAALNQYLSLTYIPAPLTIFKNIFKLEAGSYIVCKNGEVTIKRYWDINCSPQDFICDFEKCRRMLRESLFDAVRRRMVSDVPLGAFLSGGIDSSIIVGIMSRLSSRPVETFSIGFVQKDFDESSKAKLVAVANGTNHHVHYLDYADAANELVSIFNTLDEPFADTSVLPTYYVSKFARQHVKAVLTGDAGDEIFGGYSKYMINYYSSMYEKLPSFLRKHVLEKIIYRLPDRSIVSRKVRKVVENSSCSLFDRRKNLMYMGFKEDERKNLLKQSYDSECCSFINSLYEKNIGADELSRTLYTDFKVVLEGDMLAKVDRMSMINSLEARVPMLDPEVVEIAYRIPPEYKIKGRQQKFILKEAFSDLIPEQVLHQTKKGFGAPVGEWFKGPLKGELTRLLSEEIVEGQGLFNYAYINKLIEDHMKERVNNCFRLWTLFVFQLWYLRFFNL